MRGETMLLELRRALHCAAYNALVAVVSCTQTEAKFYMVFLFQDNPAKVSTSNTCISECSGILYCTGLNKTLEMNVSSLITLG